MMMLYRMQTPDGTRYRRWSTSADVWADDPLTREEFCAISTEYLEWSQRCDAEPQMLLTAWYRERCCQCDEVHDDDACSGDNVWGCADTAPGTGYTGAIRSILDPRRETR